MGRTGYSDDGGGSLMATDDVALHTAASASGLSGELSSVPQTAASITVNQDNVLQAAQIINDVLNNEGRNIQQNLARLAVAPPAQDVVSVQAAQQWNARLVTDPDSYANRVNQYLQSLQQVADNLRATALNYGYTEQQIADAFKQTAVPGGPGA
jgi:ribosomal protein L10